MSETAQEQELEFVLKAEGVTEEMATEMLHYCFINSRISHLANYGIADLLKQLFSRPTTVYDKFRYLISTTGYLQGYVKEATVEVYKPSENRFVTSFAWERAAQIFTIKCSTEEALENFRETMYRVIDSFTKGDGV